MTDETKQHEDMPPMIWERTVPVMKGREFRKANRDLFLFTQEEQDRMESYLMEIESLTYRFGLYLDITYADALMHRPSEKRACEMLTRVFRTIEQELRIANQIVGDVPGADDAMLYHAEVPVVSVIAQDMALHALEEKWEAEHPGQYRNMKPTFLYPDGTRYESGTTTESLALNEKVALIHKRHEVEAAQKKEHETNPPEVSDGGDPD
jgi:hypothetical protein